MGLNENNLERTAALCVGVASLGFGSPPPGTLEASVGLAGLIGFIRNRSAKFGPECARVRKRIQAEVLESYAQLIDGSDGDWQVDADLSAADSALHETLGLCFLDRAKLAGSAVTPEGFPAQAVTVLMAELAVRRPDLFGEGQEETLPYRYAADVVRAGIAVAVEDDGYYRALEPRLQFEMAQALGEVREEIGRISDEFKVANDKTDETLRLLSLLVGGQERRDEILTRKEHELHATRADLLGLLQGILDERIPYDHVDVALSQAYQKLKKNRAELERLRGLANEVPDIEPDLAEARTALNQANIIDLERAQSALRRARIRYREEVKAQRDRQAINLARLTETEAGMAMARSRYREAAELFAEAANELPKEHGSDIGYLRRRQGESLMEHGQLFPGLDALSESLAALEAALEIYTREDMPDAWAATLNHLGIALRIFGERRGGRAGARALEQSVTRFEAALEVYSRTYMPTEWAMTQSNLANTLQLVGKRSGGKSGVRALEQSVAAYEAALEIFTPERMPSEWAGTQVNLASTLRLVGERIDGEAGMRLLERSAATFEAALEIYTREDTPTDWAKTQNTLAITLRVIGERKRGEAGMRSLEHCVAVCEAALEILNRVDMPIDWAMTQNNLASALRVVGKRRGGEAGMRLLERSVEAYEAPLEILTKEDMPADWAMMQNNLASALRMVGERRGGEAGMKFLKRSISAYKAALEVRTRQDMPADWAMTQYNLANVLQVVGEQTSGDAGIRFLDRSIAGYEAALEVRTREDMPADWAKTQNNLAISLQMVGKRRGGTAGVRSLECSAAAYEAALEVCTREDMPASWSYSKTGLGCLWIGLGIVTANSPLVIAGMSAIDEALEILRSAASVPHVDRVLQWRSYGSEFLKSQDV